ncbi:MAG: hypothetical protein K2X74_05945, partial [Acetobacteraceae bacterium]|nr:hypothetical protein [Acetobacteraceae bacterium]
MPPLPDHPPDLPLDRPALLAALRARIARLDRSDGGSGGGFARGGRAADGVPLCPAIDAVLPGGAGLPRAAVH